MPTTRPSTSMATTCVQQAASISKPNQATPFACDPPTKVDCSPKRNSLSPSRTSTKLLRISLSRRAVSMKTLERTLWWELYRRATSIAGIPSPIRWSPVRVIPTTQPSTLTAATCVQQAASISKPNQATPFACDPPTKVDCSPKRNSLSPSRTSTKLLRISLSRRAVSMKTLERTLWWELYRRATSIAGIPSPIR